MGTAALENPCRRWITYAERWIFYSVNAKDLCFPVRRSLYFTDLTRTYAITRVFYVLSIEFLDFWLSRTVFSLLTSSLLPLSSLTS
jgi:hypothetical protein